MKVYRRHYCDRSHRSYRTWARCVWRRAEWVVGDGPYATVAYCRVLTVELHQTLEDAQAALELIDTTACGGRCHGNHELIVIAR